MKKKKEKKKENTNSLNDTDSLNQIYVFIEF